MMLSAALATFIATTATTSTIMQGPIMHRGGSNMCLDASGATNENPVSTKPCVANKTSQMFGWDSATSYIHLGTGTGATGCMEGPPCCLENFFGTQATVWGCSDPSGKRFSYDPSTGLINGGGDCLGDGGSMGGCDIKDATKLWNFTAWSKPPPGQNTCAVQGCKSTWTPGLPCQCNPTCAQYNNCCPDYSKTCHHPAGDNTCEGQGCHPNWQPGLPCQCNPECYQYDNCCSDYSSTCAHQSNSCAVIGCQSNWQPGLPCQCNPDCWQYNNCCWDYNNKCRSEKTAQI